MTKKWELVGYVVCAKCNADVYIYCTGRDHKVRLTKIRGVKK